MIRARIEPGLKRKAEKLFAELGLSLTDAIGLFFRRALQKQALPFEVKLPNKTSKNTFEQTDAGNKIEKAKDLEDLFSKLGI